MKRLHLLKWFGVGFISTLAVILFFGLAVPAIVTAQQGNPNEVFVQDGQTSIRTDDPLGRNNIPAPENSTQTSNNTLLPSPESQEEVKGGGGPTTVWLVPGPDFRSDGNIANSAYFFFSKGRWQGSSTGPCLEAPAYLPNNAKVSELLFSAVDDDASLNFWVAFYKVDNFSGVATLLSIGYTTGDSATIQTPYVSFTPEVVSYPTYSYYLGTCMNSGEHQLYSAQLWYKP
jgi:hypothetical protein